MNKRRIDLCTCGKPREDSSHTGPFDPSEPNSPRHPFMPNPQPEPLPARVNLCTCGEPREVLVHYTEGATYKSVPRRHEFVSSSQPEPSSTPAAFNRILATRANGTWVATVFDGPKSSGNIGSGQASQWRDAVDAAVEDLREKQEKAS
jgi:hypothetical protein